MDSPKDDTVADLKGPVAQKSIFGPAVPTVRVAFGALTHPGLVRTNNEDHYAVVRRRRDREVLLTNLPKNFLPPEEDHAYVITVADGVGGGVYGELASALALQFGWDLTGSAFKWHFSLTESQTQELMEHLRIYAEEINRRLRQRAALDPNLAGMATTATCVVTAGFDAVIGHVGDSRAYLFRGGSLRKLTHDQTLAQEYVDRGRYDSLESAPKYMRHVLTSYLGGKSDEVSVETYSLKLMDGDLLMLCTDGLSDSASDENMAAILTGNPDLQGACMALVDRALAAGGRDNVTVVLARFSAGEA